MLTLYSQRQNYIRKDDIIPYNCTQTKTMSLTACEIASHSEKKEKAQVQILGLGFYDTETQEGKSIEKTQWRFKRQWRTIWHAFLKVQHQDTSFWSFGGKKSPRTDSDWSLGQGSTCAGGG